MTSAHYGRMRVGECVQTNYQIGCKTDVTSQIGSRCSGDRKCELTHPEPAFARLQPCRSDLQMYIEVNYQCVSGARAFICILLLSRKGAIFSKLIWVRFGFENIFVVY